MSEELRTVPVADPPVESSSSLPRSTQLQSEIARTQLRTHTLRRRLQIYTGQGGKESTFISGTVVVLPVVVKERNPDTQEVSEKNYVQFYDSESNQLLGAVELETWTEYLEQGDQIRVTSIPNLPSTDTPEAPDSSSGTVWVGPNMQTITVPEEVPERIRRSRTPQIPGIPLPPPVPDSPMPPPRRNIASELEAPVRSFDVQEVLQKFKFLDRDTQRERMAAAEGVKINGVPRYFQAEDLALEEHRLVKHIVITEAELVRLINDPDAVAKIKSVYPEYSAIVCVKLESRRGFEPYQHNYFFRSDKPKDLCIHMTAGHDAAWLVGGQDGSGKRYRQIQDVLFTNGIHCRSATPEFCSSLAAPWSDRELIPDETEFYYSGLEIVRHSEGGSWAVLPGGTRLYFGSDVSSLGRYAPPTQSQVRGFEELIRYRNQRKHLELQLARGVQEDHLDPFIEERILRVTDSYNAIPDPSAKGDMHNDFAIFTPEVTAFIRTPAMRDGEFTPEFIAKYKQLTRTSRNPSESQLQKLYERQQEMLERRNYWILAIQRAYPDTEFFVDDLIPEGSAYQPRRNVTDLPVTREERLGYGDEAINRWHRGVDWLTPKQQQIVAAFINPRCLGITRLDTVLFQNLEGPTRLEQLLEPHCGGFFVYSESRHLLQEVVWHTDALNPSIGRYVSPDFVENGDKIFQDKQAYERYMNDRRLLGNEGATGAYEAEPLVNPWIARKTEGLTEEEQLINQILGEKGYVTERGSVYFTSKAGESSLYAMLGEDAQVLILTGDPKQLCRTRRDYTVDMEGATIPEEVLVFPTYRITPKEGDMMFPTYALYESYVRNPEPAPNPSRIRSQYLRRRSDGMYEVTDGGPKLSDIIRDARLDPQTTHLYVERPNGKRIFVQWGEQENGTPELVNFEMNRVVIRKGDKLDFDVSPEPFEFRSLNTSRTPYPLPDHMRLLPQTTPPLAEEGDLPAVADHIVGLFKKAGNYEWGARRMMEKLLSMGVNIVPQMPFMVTDIRSNTMAFYNPETKKIETVSAGWARDYGFGNVNNGGKQMLGTYQVGAIMHTGTGNDASFGQNSRTVKGTNMELIGLDRIETDHEHVSTREQVAAVHNYDRAFGNHNSYSLDIEGGDDSRGTSMHGVVKDRILGGTSTGCVLLDQGRIRDFAEVILRARAAGYNAFAETQYI